MSNHWVDIGNSSLIFVMGANPAENHPACMAHVNRARYDGWGRGRKARMVVVDPRKTRTAQQADVFVRIRPGTDIAFINGLLNYIITGADTATVDATFATNFRAWHNGTAANSTSYGRVFLDDTTAFTYGNPPLGSVTMNAAQLQDATTKVTYDGVATNAFDDTSPGAPMGKRGWPKWCDTRVKVDMSNPNAPVYKCATMETGPAAARKTFSNMVVLADSIDDPDCVYQKLKAHVAAYTAAVVADICGCAASDIATVAEELIANSQMKSNDFSADGYHEPRSDLYRATTILYAMGTTQHTYGSQNVRDFAVLQTMLGNMGRPGGGINALRGIHNVQGSTDFGVLFDGIPGYYTGNPGHLSGKLDETYASFQNRQFGIRTAGTGYVLDPYTPTNLGLQQQGFYNMTSAFFCDWRASYGADANGVADFNKLFECWPKGNGKDHISAFRAMQQPATGSPEIKACVVWGQNPANTEPNQSQVRAGLKNLDLLVVVDTFETETAAVDRKTDGVTYLLPACSYVEEAGSVSNSGRWIQWRMRARTPHGNSKADIDLLLRFAKEIDRADGFHHIKDQWLAMNTAPADATDAYKVLFGTQYGYDPGALNALVDIETAASRVSADGIGAIGSGYVAPGGTVYGTEAIAEKAFEQISNTLGGTVAGTNGGKGTQWIYARAYNDSLTSERPSFVNGTGVPWTKKNRAKERNITTPGSWNNYPRFGFAWLLNRRVMYNNVAGSTALTALVPDEADNFVGPGYLSRVMTYTARAPITLAGWTGHFSYRSYNTLRDMPSVVVGTGDNLVLTGTKHEGGLPANFPAHCEPIETPRRDLAATWGRNMQRSSDNTSYGATVKADSKVAMWGTGESYTDDQYGSAGNWGANAKDYPLVLTTIRCVEHFQGGPITRNNSWNVEAEPVPWIEINSIDARAKGIKDGDWVNVTTARSDSLGDQTAWTPVLDGSGDLRTAWAEGFKARVGVGLAGNQRVAAGVVAIPWHWGDQGLGTGSRANDLTIDAFDANTVIPEYKACLCKIEKIL
jgi:anaerobic selenocysteine-containing dehydrogenase